MFLSQYQGGARQTMARCVYMAPRGLTQVRWCWEIAALMGPSLLRATFAPTMRGESDVVPSIKYNIF